MSECYQVGGPFVAEDPACLEHSMAAEADQRSREIQERALQEELKSVGTELARLRAELDALRSWSCLSWRGFNVRGDAASIKEVKRLVEFEAARAVG